MSDVIRAALITASAQSVVGLLTIFVAVLALSSWRRNTLGARQIELAEQCFQAVWRMDEHIRAARLLLFPNSLEEIKSNNRVREIHIQSHERASTALQKCHAEMNELKNLLMLAEAYLGVFPRTNLPQTSRFFKKMSYKLDQDYEEILGQLSVCLINTSPILVDEIVVDQKSIDKFEKSAEMFHGFMYEYEEDDYSVRLRISRVAFERHISRVLRRQGLTYKLWGRLENIVIDRYYNKFKPVTVNRKPFRKFMKEQQGKIQQAHCGVGEGTHPMAAAAPVAPAAPSAPRP